MGIIDSIDSKFSMELNDSDLDSVVGGMGTISGTATRKCPGCNKMVQFILHSGGRASCPECGEKIML